MFFYVEFDIGQHVEILPMFYIAFVSRLVNMFESMNTFTDSGLESGRHVDMFIFYVGLESGHHVAILPMLSIAVDSRVVNMLRILNTFYCLGFREWSTC